MGSVLPSVRKRIDRTVTKIPVRGFVELTYTGNVKKHIIAVAGQYHCTPNSVMRVYDVDVEALLSLGCFVR